MANEGIKELGAAEGFVDSKGRIVTVEDIMNKSSSLDLVQSITWSKYWEALSIFAHIIAKRYCNLNKCYENWFDHLKIY